MYYQISEDEHRSLELLCDQLDLVTGLLSIKDAELNIITSASLFAFLDARRNELASVVQSASEREAQATAARLEEATAAKAPQVSIAAELLIGLMDAACGALTDSEALIKLVDSLYNAGVMHSPYNDVYHHFLDVMRDRGLVMHMQVFGGHLSRAFVPAKPTSKPKDTAPAKPRKREKLARVEA